MHGKSYGSNSHHADSHLLSTYFVLGIFIRYFARIILFNPSDKHVMWLWSQDEVTEISRCKHFAKSYNWEVAKAESEVEPDCIPVLSIDFSIGFPI